ncbi:hypothetical protein D7X94_11040 [Acutalibacter sp. 1XD8-33]|uniref:hypothetical protein n=1 Tax=Acutalibacter sp. 1XD8-33 TaxID=2320081 RepID=UPI000EA15408|nr:hypothetical protein [Acutalibacter sp. 1XD8-33]RKJ39767.1 hypothetical protein D7X94_11040 [Acutalibacter sp. 1XD8-33]
MTLEKFLACSGGGIFLLLTLIQIAPIQVNPWSTISRWIGKAINGEALAEIDAYERFCEDHPDYPNNKAVMAIENIRENYKELLKKHDFLQEGEAHHE